MHLRWGELMCLLNAIRYLSLAWLSSHIDVTYWLIFRFRPSNIEMGIQESTSEHKLYFKLTNMVFYIITLRVISRSFNKAERSGYLGKAPLSSLAPHSMPPINCLVHDCIVVSILRWGENFPRGLLTCQTCQQREGLRHTSDLPESFLNKALYQGQLSCLKTPYYVYFFFDPDSSFGIPLLSPEP